MSSRLVVCMFDASGSMSRYRCQFESRIPMLASDCIAHNAEPHFILFSSSATYCKNTGKIPWDGMETNLVAPLEMLESRFGNRIRALTPDCPLAVVILVTDGGAQSSRSITEIRNMKKMGGRCVLLTVAVGDAFPTALVLNTLRGIYNGGDPLDHLPPLVSLRKPRDAGTVLDFVAMMARTAEDLVRPITPPAQDTTPAELVRCIQAVSYQAVTRACRVGAEPETTVAALDAAMAQMAAAYELLSADDSGRVCNTYSSYLAFMRDLRVQCLDRVVLSRLPDRDKHRILSFGAHGHVYDVYGPHIDFALALKSGHWPAALDSFIDFVRDFRGGVCDPDNVNSITFQTEDDMLYAIKADMAGVDVPADVEDDTAAGWHEEAAAAIERRRGVLHMEVRGVVEALMRWPLPFISLTSGRRGKPVPASQVDIWRGALLRDVAKVVTTADGATFMHRGLSIAQTSNTPNVDDLLMATAYPALAGSIFAAYAATYMVARNGKLCDPMAYPAAMAGVVLHILSKDASREYERKILARIYAIHALGFMAPQQPPGERAAWAGFVRAAADPGTLGHVLVPESGCGRYICTDLRKALFAQFAARYSAGEPDVAEWTRRRTLTLIEFYARIPNAAAELPELVRPTEALHAAVDGYLRDSCPAMGHLFEEYPTRRLAVYVFVRAAVSRSGVLASVEDLAPAGLSTPYRWGLTPAIIDAICRSMCPALPPLTPNEALACIQAALGAGDGRRRESAYVSGGFAGALTVDWAKVQSDMVLPRLMPVLRSKATAFAQHAYDARFASTHRYTLPIGRTEGLDIGPYGLPRNACACPDCPFAYRALGPPEVGTGGRARMTGALLAHIEPMRAVPGFHKALHATGAAGRFRKAATARERADVVDDTLRAIVAGGELVQDARAKAVLDARLRAHYGDKPVGSLHADILRQLNELAAADV